MVKAVTGSVSWALPFGFVADFRGRGGQEEDGGNEREKTRARVCVCVCVCVCVEGGHM